MNVRCGNCGTVFDSAEQVCPTCGRGVEDVGIEEPGLATPAVLARLAVVARNPKHAAYVNDAFLDTSEFT